MADLANLLGGYGSGSEDEDASMEEAMAGAGRVHAPESPNYSPTSPAYPVASPAAGAAASGAGGDTSVINAEDDSPTASPSRAAHVIDGPTTNPEPPPEGLSPPVAPAVSGSSGAGDGGEGGLRPGDPRLLLPPELREPPPGPVDPVVQEKVVLFDSIQRHQGLTLRNQLLQDRRWNNPTFLDKMVKYFNLDPYGSCFKPEVWDPKALPEADTWRRLEDELRKAASRRSEEASRREQVPFQSSGLQAPAGPSTGGLSGGTRAPIGIGAAAAAAAAAAKAGGAAAARAPLASSDPRLAAAQAVAQALVAKGGLPPAGGGKRSKWDA